MNINTWRVFEPVIQIQQSLLFVFLRESLSSIITFDLNHLFPLLFFLFFLFPYLLTHCLSLSLLLFSFLFSLILLFSFFFSFILVLIMLQNIIVWLDQLVEGGLVEIEFTDFHFTYLGMVKISLSGTLLHLQHPTMTHLSYLSPSFYSLDDYLSITLNILFLLAVQLLLCLESLFH